MKYTKNIWTDQKVARPKTYKFNQNSDGTTTLIDDFGVVTDIGTPVNAANMNHIEDGIVNAATIDLDNLSSNGNAKLDNKANIDLDNLSSNGNAKLDRREIAEPILCFTNVLKKDEIWLEGATVSRTTYAEIFRIYGTKYGAGDGSTTFKLPDCRGKVFWGATDFGYIEAGLPNITGQLSTSGATIVGSGAFKSGDRYNSNVQGGNTAYSNKAVLDANLSSAIYGKSTTVQPPAIKVRIKTRYK